MNTSPDSASPLPFEHDVPYLVAEVGWVRLRAQRLEHEREIKEAEKRVDPRVLGSSRRTEADERLRLLPGAKQAEQDARRAIDARLHATRNAGRVLGLDALCEEHHLEGFERDVLLLGALVAMGDAVASNLDGVGPSGYWGGNLTPEVVWNFREMTGEQRIRSRTAFLSSQPLLKHGLITIRVGSTFSPVDLPCASIELTSSAFAKLVGVLELDPKNSAEVS